MKAILFIIVLVVAFNTAEAQQFSLGISSGASYLMNKRGHGPVLKGAKGQTLAWDKSLSLRITQKRLAYEISFSHYRYQVEETYHIFDVPVYHYADEHIAKDYMQMSISLQYALSARSDQRFRHFAGVAVIPCMTYTTTKWLMSNNTGESEMISNKQKSLHIWAGLNYTANYSITKHIFLSSELSYKIEPGSFFSNHYFSSLNSPNNRVGLSVGVGYML